MKLKVFRVVICFLLIGWMVLIFSLSAQDAAVSSESSTGCIEKIAKVVYPKFENLDVEQQTETVDAFQFITRKAAHFSLYAVLGILSYSALISYRTYPFKYRAAASMAICLIYAASDEIHQLFVPGRSCELRDVCIDFCGSVLAIGVCVLITRFNKKLKKFSQVVR